MDKNAGYHLGLFIRRLRRWICYLEEKVIQRGYPRWMTKTFIVLVMMVLAGLLIAYAALIAFTIALFILIAFFIANTKYVPDNSDKKGYSNPLKHAHLEGYQDGPDGIGTYVAGGKVSDNDEGLVHPDED
ncbi:DUF3742 family protein [Salmonella enterica]|nr:DUF3742 family protein [Salmonella enterica]EAX6603693.1 DUF3742 family protein [Salmonella enterica]